MSTFTVFEALLFVALGYALGHYEGRRCSCAPPPLRGTAPPMVTITKDAGASPARWIDVVALVLACLLLALGAWVSR